MESIFIPPEIVNNAQLAFLTAVYGFVLYQASNLISSGSELLLLIHEVAGLVGSIILPILGAVPDGMMVLFSGLGPNAQEEVAVGVGALAGSTAMLLTIPWFIAVFFGRVPVDQTGTPQYGISPEGTSGGAIEFKPSIQATAKIMLLTTLFYFIIQVPASLNEMKGSSTLMQSKAEHVWALIALIVSVLGFFGYLYKCFSEATEDKQLEQVIRNIKKKKIGLTVALNFAKLSTNLGKSTSMHELRSPEKKRLTRILHPFFKKYDSDDNKLLDAVEFKYLLNDLGVRVQDYNEEFCSAKQSSSMQPNAIHFEEFVDYLLNHVETLKRQPSQELKFMPKKMDEEDEQEEIPEDLINLPASVQRRKILQRSFLMMGAGTLLVLIFTDPTVEVLSEWGKRLGISPFYISFVLAPFASNASELLSAYTYAAKKTSNSITTSFSTLLGAACMNNTFCFAIFMALVWVKGLAWQFTAETIAIVVSQWIIAILVLKSKRQTLQTGFMFIAVYPLTIFIVWFLENYVGWD